MRIFQPIITGSNSITGSLRVSGSVSFHTLTTASVVNVLTYDSSSGRVYYTASNAIGGGGSGTPGGPNLSIQFNSASVFSGSSQFYFSAGDGPAGQPDVYDAIHIDGAWVTITDGNGDPIFRVEDRLLLSHSGVGSLDWGSRVLYDTIGTQSILYDLRQLQYKNNPQTVAIDWGTVGQVTVSGSVYTPNLTNLTQVNVVGINTASGQLYYFPTSSIAGGSGTPGGSDQQIQFNSSSAFSGSTNLKFDYVNNNVILTGSLLVTQSHISTVDYIDFTKVPLGSEPAHLEGRLHWYDDTKTLQIDTDKNNFMIEVGHQNVVRVYNDTGADIGLGKIVRISGSQGNQPTIVTASWNDDQSSASTLGFVATLIAGSGGNRHGYVITNGLLRNVNTTGYTVGTQLYLSTSGDFTSTPPDAPLHEVRLGKVIVSNALGVIYVDIMNGYELTELHDVRTTTYSPGDLLIQSNSLWTNSKQLTGSYGLTGSLNVLGAISASLGPNTVGFFGTASWAVSASNVSGAFMQNGNSFGATAILGTNDTQDLAFETDGSTRMTISSSGMVYINSATPYFGASVPFQVSSGGSTNGIGFRNNNLYLYPYVTSTNANTGSIILGADNAAAWTIRNYHRDVFQIRSTPGSGTAQTMLHLSSGSAGYRVGILTEDPQYTFDVSGSARITGSLYLPGVTSSPYNNLLIIDTGSGQVYVTASSAVGGSTFNSTSSILGNGLSSSFDIAHNFGTRNLHVTVYENGNNYETVYADVRRPDLNTIRVVFGGTTPPTSNQFVVYISQ